MIGLTTKYAVRILMVLNEPGDEFLNTEELSRLAEIPKAYLSKVVLRLAKCELVDTKRGKNGGVRLLRELRSISLFEVCEALEDPIIKDSCFLSKKRCNSSKHCPFHEDWQQVRQRCRDFLKSSSVGMIS